MNNFIVLEGLSGCGKSTLGLSLADAIGASFIETPSDIMEPIRSEIDRNATPLARFFFYLAGVAQTAKQIETDLRLKHVVCVRYLLTTFCWHEIIGVPTVALYPETKKMFPEPNFTFLISCEETERKRRLLQRGFSFNDNEEAKGIREELFLKSYRRYPITEVDNSNHDLSEAVNIMLNYLQGC